MLCVLISSPQTISVTCLLRKISSYDLCDATQKLSLPKPITDYLKRIFSYSGILFLLTDLPEELRITKILTYLTQAEISCSLHWTPHGKYVKR